MTDEERQKMFDEKVAAMLSSPPSKNRICAICLAEIERVRYNEHMQNVHGYTTIEL